MRMPTWEAREWGGSSMGTEARGVGRQLAAILALTLLLGAPPAAGATYRSVQIVTDEFAGFPSGPLLIYTPFDGAQGLLSRADVTIHGLLELSAMIATGESGTLLPYDFWIEQRLEASSPALGFGWAADSSKVRFQGTAPTWQPIPVSRLVTYTFGINQHTDLSGVVPVRTSGADIPPGGVATRLEHFVDTRCNDSRSYESAISMNFVPLSSQLLIVAVPYTYTGFVQITYTYITTDQLEKHVANGDFEGQSLSPWSSSGAGAGRLSSPPQCLAATLNQLLELEAGSPIEVSQSIATPADPFTLTFDYGFAQNGGTLEIWLRDTRVDQIDAAGLAMLFRTRVLSISDPALLGQAAIPLRIVWNAASGERAWIDNVQVYPVPEPAADLLAAASLLGLCGLSRRSGRPYPAQRAQPR